MSTPLTSEQIESTLTVFYQTLNHDKALDISIPADQKSYVPNIQHSGLEQGDEIAKFAKGLKRNREGGVYLFSGQVGSGKSTELLRLKLLLSSQTCKVFYIDLEKWLNLNVPVTLSSLIVSMMAGWIEQAGNQTVSQRSIADKLIDLFTKTGLAKPELKLGSDPVSLKIGFQNDENFRRDLENAISSNKKGFVEQAEAFALEHRADVCSRGEDCVLIIDSLEKIRGFGKNIDAVYASLEELFIGNSSALSFTGIKMVYSVAPSLIQQNAQLAAINGQANIVKLPSLHVINNDGAQDELGISMMLQMLDKRYSDWRTILTQAHAQRIAQTSGGDLRDFLRAVRSATLGETLAFPLTESSIQYAINQIEPPREVPQEIINWLALVGESHEASLGGNITAHTLQHYLSSKHLLMYANGKVWYDVHPLLKEWVKKRRTPAASVAASPVLASPSAATA